MTRQGFMDMIARNPYLALAKIAKFGGDVHYVVVVIPERRSRTISAAEVEKSESAAIKRVLLGCWLDHWWTKDFA